ncbi:MAG: hypothetical protein ACRDJ5_09625 [Actinomycetota bacterium]
MTAQQSRRLVDRITDPSYLEDLTGRPIEALRAMREECREGENELSFERRLCQARIDILSAELERRAGGGDEDLVSRLPEILATEGVGSEGAPLPSRAPDFSIPRNADIPRRRVEEIVGEQTLTRLQSLEAEEIRAIVASLAEHEQTVSAKRKAVHEVVDEIQAEIVRRYTSGEADPAAALS